MSSHYQDMANEVEEIKHRLDAVELIGSYLQLKKSGINYKGLCPFHSEKTPSFMVNPERQIFKCFGCDQGGDIFEFIMKMEQLTFPEALKLLAGRAGVKLEPRYPSTSSDVNKNQDARYNQAEDTKSKFYQINAFSGQVFHKILLEHPAGQPALDYLFSRGLSAESIKTFHLGFAPKTPVLRTWLVKKGFSQREIDLAGRPDRFYNRIIFPISDVLGNVLGFTGRTLDPKIEPKYLNTAETAIFKKGRLLYGLNQAKKSIRDRGYAVLVEGQMDVVLASLAGVTNVVASSGTALTRDHIKILNRYSQNLILSPDMDSAGQKATLGTILLALEADLNLKIASLPTPYKDAGEAIATDPKIYLTSLKKASYWLDWLVAMALEKYQQADDHLEVVEKKQITKFILPYIKSITNPVERTEAIKKLALRLSVTEKSILESLDRIAQTQSQIESSSNPIREKSTANLPPAQLLLGLFYLYPQEQKNNLELYKQLDKEYTDDRAELEMSVEQFYPTIDAESVSQEIEAIAKRLTQNDTETIKADFASQIAQAEGAGDRVKVKQLLQDLQAKIK